MNDQQQQHPPMSGDDDLAKALNGGLQFEETPMVGGSSVTPDPIDQPNPPMPTMAEDGGVDLPAPAPTLSSTPPPADDTPSSVGDTPELPTVHHGHKGSSTKSAAGGDLDKLKSSALEELKPLVGKLKLPAEEKFDTLLLIIRSTDDQSLLADAHAAAKEITDDTRRAQALLDVIKEIDYFSSKR